jgi:hypothetical protein
MIENIFLELRGIGMVHSRDEFSAEWLGRERSYLRCLRAKHRSPSTKVLATCAVRLLKNADRLAKAEAAIAKAKSVELRRLANTCLEQILIEGGRR